MVDQFVLRLGECRRPWLPAELAAGGDGCGKPFLGRLGALQLAGIDQLLGDLAEEFAVFGGVELLMQNEEPHAALVELDEHVGQVVQGAADMDEAADDEGAGGWQRSESLVELGPVGAGWGPGRRSNRGAPGGS